MDQELVRRILSRIINDTRQTALREWIETTEQSKEPLFDYRGDHVMLVTALARQLARAAGADETVVTLAAILHDSAKPGLGGSDEHEVLSARIAEQVLIAEGLDSGLIEQVCDVIRRHAGLTLREPLRPIEAQVLWEADKLVKLGVTGLLHYVVNGLRIRPGINMRQLAQSVIDFLPLASKIASSMNTELARKIASERMRHLREFITALNLEIEQGGIDGTDE